MVDGYAKCVGCGIELPKDEMIECNTDGIHEWTCRECYEKQTD